MCTQYLVATLRGLRLGAGQVGLQLRNRIEFGLRALFGPGLGRDILGLHVSRIVGLVHQTSPDKALKYLYPPYLGAKTAPSRGISPYKVLRHDCRN